MDINLSGQTAKADHLRPHLVEFAAELDKRKVIWDRLSSEKRRQWIQVAEAKDPLFYLFVQLVKYSRDWSVEDE